jgi:hypothetical protein
VSFIPDIALKALRELSNSIYTEYSDFGLTFWSESDSFEKDITRSSISDEEVRGFPNRSYFLTYSLQSFQTVENVSEGWVIL